MSWTRVYRGPFGLTFEVRSIKRPSQDGRLLECCAGGWTMLLDVTADDGVLVFRSRQFFWRLGAVSVPIPLWLTPGIAEVRHTDLGQRPIPLHAVLRSSLASAAPCSRTASSKTRRSKRDDHRRSSSSRSKPLLGALDNVLHHELTERLPGAPVRALRAHAPQRARGDLRRPLPDLRLDRARRHLRSRGARAPPRRSRHHHRRLRRGRPLAPPAAVRARAAHRPRRDATAPSSPSPCRGSSRSARHDERDRLRLARPLSWYFTLAALGVLAFAVRNAIRRPRALPRSEPPCTPPSCRRAAAPSSSPARPASSAARWSSA